MNVLPGMLSSLLLAAGPVEGPTEPSVKVSLSHTDPNVFSGAHTTTDPLEFFVFADGVQNRGGEFGLLLEGGDCLAFVVDEDHPWMAMPAVRPYPGTIAQARAGMECPDPPVCFGRLLVKPHKAGGRITVDVIPSERNHEVALLTCDNEKMEWFTAYPAVVNGDGKTDPITHLVSPPTEADEGPPAGESSTTPTAPPSPPSEKDPGEKTQGSAAP